MLKLGDLDPRSPRGMAGRILQAIARPLVVPYLYLVCAREREHPCLYRRLGQVKKKMGCSSSLFSYELVRRDDPTSPHPTSSIPGLLSHPLADLVLFYPLITTTAELQTPFRTSSMHANGLPAVLETSSTECNASYLMGDTDTGPSDLLVSSNLSQLDHNTQITPL